MHKIWLLVIFILVYYSNKLSKYASKLDSNTDHNNPITFEFKPNSTTSLSDIPSPFGTGPSQASESLCLKCIELIDPLVDDFHKHPQIFEPVLEWLCYQIITEKLLRSDCFSMSLKFLSQLYQWEVQLTGTNREYCSMLGACPVHPSPNNTPVQVYTTMGPTPQHRWFVWAMNEGLDNAVVQISTDLNDFDDKTTKVSLDFRIFESKFGTYPYNSFQGYIYNAYGDMSIHSKAQKDKKNQSDSFTTWYYRVGVDKNWSQIYPLYIYNERIGTNDNPLRLLSFGDVDICSKTVDTWKYIENIITKSNNTIHMVLLLGDIGYIDMVEDRWNQWGNRIEEIFTKNGISILSIAGNHETLGYYPGDDIYLGYSMRYPRTNGGYFDFRNVKGTELSKVKGNAPMYHSLTWFSHVHFHMSLAENEIVQNSFGIEPEQLVWAKKDLEFGSKNAKWIIAATHRPYYCESEPNENICKTDAVLVQRAFCPMYTKFEVDLHIAGHLHEFQTNIPTDLLPYCDKLIKTKHNDNNIKLNHNNNNNDDDRTVSGVNRNDCVENNNPIIFKCITDKVKTSNLPCTDVFIASKLRGKMVTVISGAGGNRDWNSGEKNTCSLEGPIRVVSIITISTDSIIHQFDNILTGNTVETVIIQKNK